MTIKDQLITSPAKFFIDPMDLGESDLLKSNEKMIALRNWKDMIVRLSSSEAEGMAKVSRPSSDHERDKFIKQINILEKKYEVNTNQ